MADSVGSVLPELIPLALVIALSPLSVIPAVLALHTDRPRPTGLAFLAGWLLGLTALVSLFVIASDLVGSLDKPPGWAAWVRIVAGAALIIFGVYKWVTRTKSEHSPAWMRKLSGLTPSRAILTAAVLAAVNPKVLFICIAAGLAIGTAGIGQAHAWVAVVCFVVISASTAILPILAYVVSGERLAAPLTRLKDWMEQQHATLVAAILLVIGVMVLYKGIHGLP